MFSVGDKIVYPMHGAGVIQSIEEKKILGENKQYYILNLPCNDVSVMIPVATSDAVGIRPVVDKETIDNVVDLLRSESTEMDGNWSRRCRENMEKLRTGDIISVTEVVRNLNRMDRMRTLSAGERKLMLKANKILISEIVLVLEIEPEEAERLVNQAI